MQPALNGTNWYSPTIKGPCTQKKETIKLKKVKIINNNYNYLFIHDLCNLPIWSRSSLLICLQVFCLPMSLIFDKCRLSSSKVIFSQLTAHSTYFFALYNTTVSLQTKNHFFIFSAGSDSIFQGILSFYTHLFLIVNIRRRMGAAKWRHFASIRFLGK